MDAVPELERLAAGEPLNEDWWSLLAVALYRSGRQADALSALRQARSHLADELGLDPGPRLAISNRRSSCRTTPLDVPDIRGSNGLGGTGAPRVPARRVEGCPYKGLAVYEVEDSELFHGRNRLVGRLIGTLVDHPLLVVSGSSGAGKSSVVRAGVLPALASGAVPGSRRLEAGGGQCGCEPRRFAGRAVRSGQIDGGPIVLVCDQLEQLWSADTIPAERVAFLDNVLGLLDDGAVKRCVLVIRGDHLVRMGEQGDLAERMVGSLVLVPPLNEVELREVIEEPATAAGLRVEPELTDQAIRDVTGHPGALPLLSAALAGTWERRHAGTLTLAGYLASGGVAGAVASSGEAVWASFDDRGREVTRQVLIRLVDHDNGRDAALSPDATQ